MWENNYSYTIYLYELLKNFLDQFEILLKQFSQENKAYVIINNW